MSITAMLAELKSERKFVPAIDARKLGRMMFEKGQPIDDCLSDEMRRGWLSALRAAAYAEGSEYLVSQGQEVSL